MDGWRVEVKATKKPVGLAFALYQSHSSHLAIATFTSVNSGTYLHQDASVSTVTVKVLLVASVAVPPRVVDKVLSAMATHIPDLLARHPIAAEIDLNKRPTVVDGMSIELHPGAEMFYQRASRP